MAVRPFYPQLSGNISLLLEATDIDGNTVQAPFTVSINSDEMIKVSHVLVMNIRTDYKLFTYNFDHIIWWTGNVTAYFNESKDTIRVLSVRFGDQPSVLISWTNNTINNVIPPYTCPFGLILGLLHELRNDSFRSTLSQYLITSVELTVQGVCEGFTTSTTTSTTVTREITTPSTTTTTLLPTTTTVVPTSTSTTTSTSMYVIKKYPMLDVLNLPNTVTLYAFMCLSKEESVVAEIRNCLTFNG